MITTPRSLLVGIAAWSAAFLIAYYGRINPTQLAAWEIVMLILSITIGFVAAITFGRRFCRYDFERGNAVMVFSISYFIGIFAPVMAVWANSPFYDWVIKQ